MAAAAPPLPESSASAAEILLVGYMCGDIVLDVPAFPHEDFEVRVTGKRIARGGNCPNSAVVLRQLGHPSSLMAVCGNQLDSARPALADLDSFGVDHALCQIVEDTPLATSYIVNSAATGSRTIFHHSSQPEVSVDHFRQSLARNQPARGTELDLDRFDWIHLEARTVDSVFEMLQLINRSLDLPDGDRSPTPVSLEMEKERYSKRDPENLSLDSLVPHVDLVFWSREIITNRHLTALAKAGSGVVEQAQDHANQPPTQLESPEEFMRTHYRKFADPHRGTVYVCGWGEHGSYALFDTRRSRWLPADCREADQDSPGQPEATLRLLHAPARPIRVQDSVGAGDSFHAGVIAALSRDLDLRQALSWGCRVAEHKLERPGFRLDLEELWPVLKAC